MDAAVEPTYLVSEAAAAGHDHQPVPPADRDQGPHEAAERGRLCTETSPDLDHPLRPRTLIATHRRGEMSSIAGTSRRECVEKEPRDRNRGSHRAHVDREDV